MRSKQFEKFYKLEKSLDITQYSYSKSGYDDVFLAKKMDGSECLLSVNIWYGKSLYDAPINSNMSLLKQVLDERIKELQKITHPYMIPVKNRAIWKGPPFEWCVEYSYFNTRLVDIVAQRKISVKHTLVIMCQIIDFVKQLNSYADKHFRLPIDQIFIDLKTRTIKILLGPIDLWNDDRLDFFKVASIFPKDISYYFATISRYNCFKDKEKNSYSQARIFEIGHILYYLINRKCLYSSFALLPPENFIDSPYPEIDRIIKKAMLEENKYSSIHEMEDDIKNLKDHFL